MIINEVEKKILECLNIGDNHIDVNEVANITGYTQPTASKYLNILQQKGYIKKVTKGFKGGSTYDRKRYTVITKIKGA